MLRRLKREVMAQLPRKRRQVVRLPCPTAADWAAAGGMHTSGLCCLLRCSVWAYRGSKMSVVDQTVEL